MNIFIYLCFIAPLLTVISARLRLTTSMPSEVRKNDDAARETSNIAEMIDFVNSFLTDDGQGIARRGRYDPMLRRFELPAVKDINLPTSAAVPNDEGTENQLENRADTVRYQVIDNPEVLEGYSNKQKQKNNEKLSKLSSKPAVSVVSDTNEKAKSFSTVEKKIRYYHSKSTSNAAHKRTNNIQFDEFLHTLHPNPRASVQELTTVKLPYRPSFSDDDDDDDDEVSVTEKEISTPKSDAKSHDDLKINNIVEITKRTLNNKAAGKGNQAGIEEEKAPIDDTKEAGQMKHELPLKKDKNNYYDGVTVGVTVNKEKSGSNKENMSSKLDNNSNEKPSEDNIRTRDEDFGTDGNKNKNVTTDTNSEKDEKLKGRSWDKNNNHDYKELHSSYSHKRINENSKKKFKNSHEKRDEYDDGKKKDKNDDIWSENEKYTNTIFKKRYSKVNEFDRMEYEWNKRHKQYDENDNLNVESSQWDKDDDFDSRDRHANKRDSDWDKRDDDWKKRDKEWKKRDFDLNKRDNDWNERHIDSNKRDTDWNNRDIHTNKRDSHWNKRDKNWNKRDTAWIKQDSNFKIYNVDRNNNHVVIRKQNEWENKYSHTSVESDGDIARESYETVERKIKDDDESRHSEI